MDLSSATVQRLQRALEAGAAIPYTAKDGTILLVIPPPKPVIDTIKDRLVRMTPGQHRIALQRITDVLSRIEDATTNDMAQVKAWLAEGLKVRHLGWRPEEWVWLNGGLLQDENGKTWDPAEFFEEHPNHGTWAVVP